MAGGGRTKERGKKQVGGRGQKGEENKLGNRRLDTGPGANWLSSRAKITKQKERNKKHTKTKKKKKNTNRGHFYASQTDSMSKKKTKQGGKKVVTHVSLRTGGCREL